MRNAKFPWGDDVKKYIRNTRDDHTLEQIAGQISILWHAPVSRSALRQYCARNDIRKTSSREWTTKELKTAFELWDYGRSIGEISAEINRSVNSVSSALKRERQRA